MLEVVVGHVNKQPITRTIVSPNHQALVQRILQLEASQPFDQVGQKFPNEIVWSDPEYGKTDSN